MNAFRSALVAIIDADGPQATAGTMQNLCGRTSDIARAYDALAGVQLPAVSYFIVDAPQTPQNGDHRSVLVQLDVWADEASAYGAGSGGLDTAERLAARLQAILTEPAFRGQSVDAAPVRITEADVPELADEHDAAGRRRKLVEITFAYKRA